MAEKSAKRACRGVGPPCQRVCWITAHVLLSKNHPRLRPAQYQATEIHVRGQTHSDTDP